MLFVEVGCLGDLRQAASDVEVASKKIMGANHALHGVGRSPVAAAGGVSAA